MIEVPYMLSAAEAAALLRLKTHAVHVALQKGEIPGAIKIGGTWRINRRVLLEWVGNGTG